jgi:hypothetical protein
MMSTIRWMRRRQARATYISALQGHGSWLMCEVALKPDPQGISAWVVLPWLLAIHRCQHAQVKIEISAELSKWHSYISQQVLVLPMSKQPLDLASIFWLLDAMFQSRFSWNYYVCPWHKIAEIAHKNVLEVTIFLLDLYLPNPIEFVDTNACQCLLWPDFPNSSSP